MNSKPSEHTVAHLDSVPLYALRALPPREMLTVEAQISACAECRQEMEALAPVIHSFVSWPTDLLRPSAPLWERLKERIAKETNRKLILEAPALLGKSEWEQAAPGISVKLLGTDTAKNRVSMLVRLAPGTDYPPHRHAGIEELHLLHGELMIDEKKLYPGDYIRAEPDSVDHRVWSDTGCTCVLLTSTNDVIL